MKYAPKGKVFVVRTVSLDGDTKEIPSSVQEEFCDSLQTAKERIKPNGLMVAVGSKLETKNHIEYYSKHGLLAKYALKEDVWFTKT